MMPIIQQSQPPTSQHQQQQQQSLPQVLSPNIEEPYNVLSPTADLGFTPNDFADYLNNVDNSIDNCRDLIGIKNF